MKLRKLLVCGIATGLLVGCSTTPDDQKPQLTEKTRIKDKERKIEQNPTIQYLFGNSAEVKLLLPGVIGGSDQLYGVLGNPIKKTIKSIWRKFENKGFSGYNASLLDGEKVGWSASFNAVYTSMRSLAPPQTDNDFHSRFVEYLVNLTSELSLSKEYFPFEVTRQELKHAKTLFGLKYQGRDLTVVKTDDGKYEAVLAKEFRPGAVNSGSFSVPPKIDSDIPVTQAQIDEWNQVFIDALKADPFFGKDEEASDFDPRKYRSYGNNADSPTDTSDSASTLAALKGKSGMDATSLMMNGVSGSHVDLGLPVYVQLKGSMDQGKSTTGMTGLVAYKLGNSVLGVIQSYANFGNWIYCR